MGASFTVKKANWNQRKSVVNNDPDKMDIHERDYMEDEHRPPHNTPVPPVSTNRSPADGGTDDLDPISRVQRGNIPDGSERGEDDQEVDYAFREPVVYIRPKPPTTNDIKADSEVEINSYDGSIASDDETINEQTNNINVTKQQQQVPIKMQPIPTQTMTMQTNLISDIEPSTAAKSVIPIYMSGKTTSVKAVVPTGKPVVRKLGEVPSLSTVRPELTSNFGEPPHVKIVMPKPPTIAIEKEANKEDNDSGELDSKDSDMGSIKIRPPESTANQVKGVTRIRPTTAVNRNRAAAQGLSCMLT